MKKKRRPEPVPVMRPISNGEWEETGETVIPSWKSLLGDELTRIRFQLWENPSAAFIAGRAWGSLTSTTGMTRERLQVAQQLRDGIPIPLRDAILRADADWLEDFALGLRREQTIQDDSTPQAQQAELLLETYDWMFCNSELVDQCGSFDELVNLLQTRAGIEISDEKRLREKLREVGLKLGETGS